MRQVGLSVLKTICCFSAVTFYSTSQLCTELCFLNNHMFSVLYFLSIVATPLFFLINGFTDHNKTAYRIHWDKIFSVILIFLFWNAVSLLIFRSDGINSYFLQSWLLISLASIYLLNPLFSLILSKKRWAINTMLLFSVFICLLDLLTLLDFKLFTHKIPSHFRIWTWFFYYYLGRFLALPFVDQYTKNIRIRRVVKWGWLPLVFVFYVYETLISKYLLKRFDANDFLDSFLLMLLTLSFFILFDNIRIKRQWLIRVFHFIAPAMVGVYILHDAVFYYLNYFFPLENAIVAIVYLVIVFTISVLISHIFLLNKYTARLIRF